MLKGKKDLYTCRLDLNFVSNQSRLTHEVYKNGLNWFVEKSDEQVKVVKLTFSCLFEILLPLCEISYGRILAHVFKNVISSLLPHHKIFTWLTSCMIWMKKFSRQVWMTKVHLMTYACFYLWDEKTRQPLFWSSLTLFYAKIFTCIAAFLLTYINLYFGSYDRKTLFRIRKMQLDVLR